MDFVLAQYVRQVDLSEGVDEGHAPVVARTRDGVRGACRLDLAAKDLVVRGLQTGGRAH